jgi:hypothetical protein
MNKVFENFRDHPGLRDDSTQFVFKIDQNMYLISDGILRKIIPKAIRRTNIGEPYANLVRLEFVYADNADDEYGECVDFSPDHETELRQLIS